MQNTAIKRENNTIQFPISAGMKIVSPTPREKRSKTQEVSNNSFVDPIKNKSDIEKIKNYFLNQKSNKNHTHLRNYMLFVLGINLGYRVSDLCGLKAKDILNSDNTFKTHVLVKAKKTRKYHKNAINNSVQEAVTKYYSIIGNWPNQEEYLFKSAKGNHLVEDSIQQLMKKVQHDCNINANLGSHSLRKTFARQALENSNYNNRVLLTIQDILGHDDWATTMRYLGIDQDEKDEIILGLNL